MSIYFSAIALKTFILAKCASYPGDFTEVTDQVLAKIPPEDNVMTYSSDNYLFHYIAENQIVYFCVTDSQFPSSRAFSFLNKVKFRFLDSLGRMQLAMLPYALLTLFNDGEFYGILESETARYNNNNNMKPRNNDNVKAKVDGIRESEKARYNNNNNNMKSRNMDDAIAGVDELKGIVVQCLNKMVVRRDRLESLANRASELETSAMVFKRCATQTSRMYWWKNKRIYVFVVIVLLFVAYGTGTVACGGLLWPSCV